mmetsp:Transcript_38570/g.46650  ORF Transcript_38570/g.46650 Transcript_38570/m.46650 type:complete len:273 (-) Transcript_38570:887-1705(-)|eukprot:CAMPEP_0197861970 /NCGR_PEP_ID=MMETSP1438-20131217/38354_1 /TAXON_ID=1461541 /ORGANISM="Pterosperma sp., Strain CCMP1384" /LENGTH=272 /DNA_ID=CAMNT_0043479343 /DNA_START=134 /DNA_END=952 /DNA_ORIENTATION=-
MATPELALAPSAKKEPESDSDSGSDSESDSEDEGNRKPKIGAIKPERCAAVGSGVSGGAAQSVAKFTVISKDSQGARVRTAGEKVTCKVVGKDIEDITGEVKDGDDGSYSCTYTVPTRGSYTVHVDMNDIPIEGSPFPVFFSAPDPSATPAPAPTVPGNTPIPIPGIIDANDLIQKAQANLSANGLPTLGALPNVNPLGSLPGAASVSNPTQSIQNIIANYGGNTFPNMPGHTVPGLVASNLPRLGVPSVPGDPTYAFCPASEIFVHACIVS